MLNKFLQELKQTLLKIEMEEHKNKNTKTQEHIKYIKKMIFNIELELIKKGEFQ